MLNARRHAWLATSVLFGVLASLPVAEAETSPDFEIREWFALGSGCRALPGAAGDVTLKARAEGGLRYALSLNFPSFGLDGNVPAAPGATTFARECGVRMAVYPHPGRRLRALSASSGFVFSKDVGARLRLRARLQLGSAIVAQEEQWVESEVEVSREVPETRRVELSPSAEGPIRGVRCEQPKIVGVDLSMATFRDDLSPQVAAFVLNRTLLLRLEFEPCTRSTP